MARTFERRTVRTQPSTGARHPIQWLSGLVGAVFLTVGILGFIPGITQNVGSIEWFGPETSTQLFGLFAVSIFHNLFHLAFGVAGIAMAATAPSARSFLVIGGLIYLALWVYGLAIDLDSAWNFIPVNEADNWLHFGLGVGMLALGFLPTGRARTTT